MAIVVQGMAVKEVSIKFAYYLICSFIFTAVNVLSIIKIFIDPGVH